jgi:hypothetical protein
MGSILARGAFSIPPLICLVVMALVAPASGRDRKPVVHLGAGDSHFWVGPYIEDLEGGDNRCGSGEKCFRYRLAVTEHAARLRVALDYPMGDDQFDLRLRSPGGRVVTSRSAGLFSQEAFAKDPRRGVWIVEVVPRHATKTAFRLRAKLERAHRTASARTLLAPNLRTEPPFGFTFRLNRFTAGGSGIQKVTGDTCAPDEKLENGARTCLRFWVGPQNAGRGPLELRFAPVSDALTEEAPMYQRLHYSDGSTRERRAGAYEYHKTHGHYHFKGFSSLRLFRVKDRTSGRMIVAGQGRKSGFCFGDVKMNSWPRFIHDRAYSAHSNCASPTEAYMGLSTGWTDVYDSQTPGNYVEFEGNEDGLYVLRATVDKNDKILEAEEHDNTSYAYIRIRGKRIVLLERGYGRDPWDPDKRAIVNWVALLRAERW